MVSTPTSYQYGGRQSFQDNYYGTMPLRTSYGYSGQGPQKNSNMNVILAGAAGLGVGAAVGVGGYMAYKAMTRPDYGTGTYYDQSWCTRPDGDQSVMKCEDCFKVSGSQCKSSNGCYQPGGCEFKMGKNMERDDIMSVGFVPDYFNPPLTVTITKIVGNDFLAANICPKDLPSGARTFTSTWAKAESVNVDLFFTLTQVEKIASKSSSTGSSTGQTSGAYTSMAVPAYANMLGVFLLLRWIHRLF